MLFIVRVKIFDKCFENNLVSDFWVVPLRDQFIMWREWLRPYVYIQKLDKNDGWYEMCLNFNFLFIRYVFNHSFIKTNRVLIKSKFVEDIYFFDWSQRFSRRCVNEFIFPKIWKLIKYLFRLPATMFIKSVTIPILTDNILMIDIRVTM